MDKVEAALRDKGPFLLVGPRGNSGAWPAASGEPPWLLAKHWQPWVFGSYAAGHMQGRHHHWHTRQWQQLPRTEAAQRGLCCGNGRQGSEYTSADAMLTATLFRAGMGQGRERLLASRPALAAYWQRVKERPSFAQVYATSASGWKSLKLVGPALASATWGHFTRRWCNSSGGKPAGGGADADK